MIYLHVQVLCAAYGLTSFVIVLHHGVFSWLDFVKAENWIIVSWDNIQGIRLRSARNY